MHPEDVVIPDDALSESFLAATGPGGQNANKVATAVQLRALKRFDVAAYRLCDDECGNEQQQDEEEKGKGLHPFPPRCRLFLCAGTQVVSAQLEVKPAARQAEFARRARDVAVVLA